MEARRGMRGRSEDDGPIVKCKVLARYRPDVRVLVVFCEEVFPVEQALLLVDSLDWSYGHLGGIQPTHIVCQIFLEASSHKSSRSIFARKESIASARSVHSSISGNIIHVSTTGEKPTCGREYSIAR